MANNKRDSVSDYQSLLLEYAPRLIRGERQYKRVLQQINSLMGKEKLTDSEEDLLELLGTLVALYEERHYPAAAVSPGEVVAHLTEVRGVSKAEVARATGIARQTLTNIVNGTRGISKANRAKLAKYFHVAAEHFVD